MACGVDVLVLEDSVLDAAIPQVLYNQSMRALAACACKRLPPTVSAEKSESCYIAARVHLPPNLSDMNSNRHSFRPNLLQRP